MKKVALPKEDKSGAPTSIETQNKMGSFDKYHVENALRTITDAHAHMQNPELMPHVKKLAKQQKKALTGILKPDDGDSDESVESAQDKFDEKPSTKGLRKLASAKALA